MTGATRSTTGAAMLDAVSRTVWVALRAGGQAGGVGHGGE